MFFRASESTGELLPGFTSCPEWEVKSILTSDSDNCWLLGVVLIREDVINIVVQCSSTNIMG